MKNYLLLLTLTLTLFAQNPKSFAALGDVIYDDVPKFEQLKEIPAMHEYASAIDAYILLAEETKKMGFAIDTENAKKGKKNVDGKAYLEALRKLSTQHDTILDNASTRFKEAINDEDGATINAMINYGIIVINDYEDELIRYYEEFGEDQNLSSLDVMYAQHINSLKKDDNVTSISTDQKEARDNEARIQRMRAKTKAKTDALEKSVREEQAREKKKVLDEQKKALGI